MLFAFGRDVNIKWKHAINAVAESETNDEGRISIILWGLTTNVTEEDNSPPLLTDNTRGNGYSMHHKSQNFHRRDDNRHRGGDRGGDRRDDRRDSRREDRRDDRRDDRRGEDRREDRRDDRRDHSRSRSRDRNEGHRGRGDRDEHRERMGPGGGQKGHSS